jgi:GT2 family glycosyltransferase
MLRDSLPAVIGQTREPDRVVVVDNGSDDGTGAMLAESFPGALVVTLEANQGATGGFHEAIAAALREGADWLWLLDDDCFPRPTALAELLAALERLDGAEPPALLSSRVEWRDGRPHPMNRPIVRSRDEDVLFAALRDGLLPVRAATWVSLLISKEAVERSGMPLRHFFYQADDIEYTARILRRARGYFVPTSVVEHRTPAQHTAVDDDHRFFHHTRNTVLMLRGGAWAPSEKPSLVWWLVRSSAAYLRLNRFSRASVRTLIAGLAAGLRLPAR